MVLGSEGERAVAASEGGGSGMGEGGVAAATGKGKKGCGGEGWRLRR